MSAIQKVLYRHMQKGILLTDGSEKDKKVRQCNACLQLLRASGSQGVHACVCARLHSVVRILTLAVIRRSLAAFV